MYTCATSLKVSLGHWSRRACWLANTEDSLHSSRRPQRVLRSCHRVRRRADGGCPSAGSKSTSNTAPAAELPSVNAAIATLAVPALGTELIDPLLSACDTAFVGRLDAQQLAGVGIASSVFTYVTLFFNFLSTASAPLIAQLLARKDETAARNTAGNAISLAVLLGCICCLLLETNAERAVQLVAGGDISSAGVAADYLRVRAIGIPFTLLTTALGGIFRGRLDTKTPLIVAAAANAVNLALDPLLIFGFGPVAKLAAPGAAAATVVAEVIGASLLLQQLRSTPLWPQSFGLPAWAEVKDFVGASSAVLVRTGALQSTLLLATSSVSRHAGDAGVEVAAHQVTLQSFFFLSYLCDALATAANGIVADSIGRDDFDRAREAATKCLLYGGAITAVLAVVLGAKPQGVAAIFTNQQEVQSAATAAMLVLAAMQPLNAITFVGDGIFQGAADFRYLAASMAVACSMGAGSMLLAGGTLQSVWLSLLLLQLFRALAIGARFFDVVPAFGGSPLSRTRW